MSSYEQNFSSAVNAFVVSSIITPIIGYLQTKGVQVTQEELLQVLKMPASPVNKIPMPIGFQMPQLSSNSQGGSITPANRENTGGGCIYVYSRGENKGMACNKPTDGETSFCRVCKFKKSSGLGLTKPDSKTKTTAAKPAAGISAFPGFAGIAPQAGYYPPQQQQPFQGQQPV